jgi:thymidine kinase
MMAKLDIIFGPMFAGKSTELLRRINQLKVLKLPFLVVKPNIDTRYSEKAEIVSHDESKYPCLMYSNLNELVKKIKLDDIKYNTIFIEESQFFPDLFDNVIYIVEKLNINTVIVGLDGDSNRNTFGDITKLIPYSDNCYKISSLCKKCGDGTKAIFTNKIIKNNNVIDVGTDDIYEALCRKHYLEANQLI